MPRKTYHLRLDAIKPEETEDWWNITVQMAWTGLDTAQELALLEELQAQQFRLLARAKELAAAKGIVPDAPLGHTSAAYEGAVRKGETG